MRPGRTNGIEVYRIFSARNLFVYLGYNMKLKRDFGFIINNMRNDYQNLVEHLMTLEGQVGFDNVNIDYQVLHTMITSRLSCGTMKGIELCTTLNSMYSQFKSESSPIVYENRFFVEQLDLSKMFGLNTNTRHTTIEGLYKTLGFGDLKYPMRKGQHVISDGKFEEVIYYLGECVRAERALFLLASGNSKSGYQEGNSIIAARNFIRREYGIKSMNISDNRLGERLVATLYARLNDTDVGSVMGLSGTKASTVDMSAIIDDTDFSCDEFRDYFTNLSKRKIKISDVTNTGVYALGIGVRIGGGGIHGCVDPGEYKAEEGEVVMYQDITSFYASMAVANKLYPAHMNPNFSECLLEILKMRMKAIDDDSTALVNCSKKMLTGIYGKFKDEKSFLHDPALQVRIITMCQMYMCRWMEMLHEINGVRFLSVNTDGLIYIAPSDSLDRIAEINDALEADGFAVKTIEGDRLIVKDVNNFMLMLGDEPVSRSGVFDPSFSVYRSFNQRIIAKTICRYLVGGESYDDISKDTEKDVLNDAFTVINQVKCRQLNLFS